MKRVLFKVVSFSSLTFFVILSLVSSVYAGPPDIEAQVLEQLQTSGQNAEVTRGGYAPLDPRYAAAAIVQILLSLLGTIFLALIVMSGYWLLTARGQEEKVEKAQKTIRGAVIGLIIVLAAYAITIFITSRLGEVVGSLFAPGVAYAESDLERQLEVFAGEQGAGFGDPTDPRLVVANIVRIFLTLLGILFVAYTVYAGYLVMTSGGQEEKIKKGKDTLRTGVIGILIILSAYAITLFVTNSLQTAIEDEGFDAGIDVRENVLPTPRDPLGGSNPYVRPF